MSIVLSKVAEPYAEALLELAKSNGALKETTNDMNIVTQLLANSSDLKKFLGNPLICLLYTSPSPRDYAASRMPSSA